MKQLTTNFLILFCVLFATTVVGAQTNLLLNGQADSKIEHWYAENASVEEFNGDKVFAVRSGGHLQQYIDLTDEAVGKYALFIGRVSSEQINVDGRPFANPPVLYIANTNTMDITNGQILRDKAKNENDWFTMFAIYRLPEKSKLKANNIECFLYGHGTLYDSSEASTRRFDNLGFYLFDTEADALKFAAAYK